MEPDHLNLSLRSSLEAGPERWIKARAAVGLDSAGRRGGQAPELFRAPVGWLTSFCASRLQRWVSPG